MKFDIVRAWKDDMYRQALSQEDLSRLPANPVGEMELSDACLDTIHGGGSIPGGSNGFKIDILPILNNIRVNSVTLLASVTNGTCFLNH